MTRKPKTPQPARFQQLEDVFAELRIQQWDVLIAGDGSGTGWADCAGYAAIVIDRVARTRMLLHGAVNAGSVNLAEALPYLHGLVWYHHTYGESRLRTAGRIHVHILTDSQVTCTHGNQALDLTRPLAEVNAAVWAGIREYNRLGYALQFHWLERLSTDLNAAADLVASLARRTLLDYETPLLPGHQTACDAARLLAGVGLTDPRDGQSIDLHGITPHDATQ